MLQVKKCWLQTERSWGNQGICYSGQVMLQWTSNVPSFRNPRVSCHSLPHIDLTAWRETPQGCQIGGRSVAVGGSGFPTPCTSCVCTVEGVSSFLYVKCYELIVCLFSDDFFSFCFLFFSCPLCVYLTNQVQAHIKAPNLQTWCENVLPVGGYRWVWSNGWIMLSQSTFVCFNN